jgi:hypothetical protein
MAEIINFRRARTSKVRAEKEQRAAENRAKALTPKSLHRLEKKRREKILRDLEGHKREQD